jgi:hypothetical protein
MGTTTPYPTHAPSLSHDIETAGEQAVSARAKRALLMLGTVAAFAVAGSLDPSATSAADPDLVRLMRFMALLKGAFLLVALVGSFWRLARPAASWRTAIYVGGPPLMAAGTMALWRMQDAGLAASVLHVGLFALLAAALTDRDFIPALRRG